MAMNVPEITAEIRQNLDDFAKEWTSRQLVWGFVFLQGIINIGLVTWNYILTSRLSDVEAVTDRWLELLGK